VAEHRVQSIQALSVALLICLGACAADGAGTDSAPGANIGLPAGAAGIGAIAGANALGTAGVGAAGIGGRAGAGVPTGLAGIGASDRSAGRGGVVGAGGAGTFATAGRSSLPPFAGMGVSGTGGPLAAAGMGGQPAAAGAAGQAGAAGMSAAASGETGRMVGMTAAHNMVRAAVQTTPPLQPLTWSPTLAAYAQEWSDMLAMTSCTSPRHRSGADLQKKGYGENLAAAGSSPPRMTTPSYAVNGWAGEVKCWTYGTIAGTEKCDTTCYMGMHSDGCGHYTQIVWRDTTQVGCGVSTCTAGGITYEIWICNYSPAGNFVGRAPY
jgi:pathogenesis-related protein 1